MISFKVFSFGQENTVFSVENSNALVLVFTPLQVGASSLLAAI